MGQRISREFHWNEGYIPTQTKAGGIPGSIIDGLNAWVWGAGLLESAKGFGSAGSSGGANPLMNVGNTHGGWTSGGTVVEAFGTTWAQGVGAPYKGGVLLGTGAVNNTLLMLRSGALIATGLPQPTAPVISDSGVAGVNNGSYSIVITAIDKTTGQESTRSLSSNIVVVSLKRILVTYDNGGALLAPNQTHWGIYASFRNFGATGPWFHVTDKPAGNPSNQFQWSDGDLGEEAPIDHDLPPQGSHCFALNNVMVSAGCYPIGGSGLGPSVPGSPGAYPPDFTVFLPGGGSITSCKATGFAGSVIISTASSLTAVVATNSPITPLTVRQIWPTTGFATGSAWCCVEGEVYGFSGQRGAVRTQGDGPPDTTFANPVHKAFADLGFTGSNAAVGYDPRTDTIMFASGTKVLCYARSRNYWHCPMSIAGSVTSATVGGQLLIDTGGGSLVASELGTGVSGFATFAFDDGGAPEFNKTICRLRAASNATVSLDVLADLDLSTSQASISAGAPHSSWQHLNVRNAKTFTAKVSWTTSGVSLYEMIMEVVPHLVTR